MYVCMINKVRGKEIENLSWKIFYVIFHQQFLLLFVNEKMVIEYFLQHFPLWTICHLKVLSPVTPVYEVWQGGVICPMLHNHGYEALAWVIDSFTVSLHSLNQQAIFACWLRLYKGTAISLWKTAGIFSPKSELVVTEESSKPITILEASHRRQLQAMSHTPLMILEPPG